MDTLFIMIQKRKITKSLQQIFIHSSSFILLCLELLDQ